MGKPVTVRALRAAYRQGTLVPSDCVRSLLPKLDSAPLEIFISRASSEALLEQARALDRLLADRGPALLDEFPLFGIPYAVKDNLDVAGVPTTVACPDFAYVPAESAIAVARVQRQHALYVGKTNLDQFATGLVGTRSPYGIVRNPLNPEFVAGGSSSGSAVAVATGLVAFSLATDTAGSGRVPAGFNGVVGIKPSRGLVSTAGMVPAVRSFDSVTVMAVDVEDAWELLRVVAEPQPVATGRLPHPPLPARSCRLGTFAPTEFFGDALARGAYEASLLALRGLTSGTLIPVDPSPFLAAGRLLYDGPWIAQRRSAVGSFLEHHPDSVNPVVRAILRQGERYSAVQAFDAMVQLQALQRETTAVFSRIDALLVPTAPEHPRIAEVEADPVVRNTRLGHYTFFGNLLDLAAIAFPGLPRDDGLPAGLTLIGPAGSDHRLATLAAEMQECLRHAPAGTAARVRSQALATAEPCVELAVVGAHLSGQPLNGQLLEGGARLLATTRTAARYRLFALPGLIPPKPGLVRVAADGAAIEVETWSVPVRAFGAFVSRVPSPMAIGSIELTDGRWVSGFVCEPLALSGAIDISSYGGWRGWLAAQDSVATGARPEGSLT